MILLFPTKRVLKTFFHLKFYLFYFIVDMISVRTFLSQKYKTGDICQGLQQ